MTISLPIQTLVISLERSEDRREKVAQEMAKVSMPWSFLNAIDGSLLKNSPPEYKRFKVKLLLGHELTSNEIGCYLSHKEAWKRCIEKDMPTLVLEDDFVLSPTFQDTISELLLNQHIWDFVRLQGLYEVPYKELALIRDVHLVKNLGDAVGATAYLLKPHVAQVLINESIDIYEPVDHFLEHRSKHCVDFMAVHPYPVDISRVKSTIDDRSERAPVKGFRKRVRSIARALDRLVSPRPWFPK